MHLFKKLLILSALIVAASLVLAGAASAAKPAQTRVIVTLDVPAPVAGEDQSIVIAHATDALLILLPGGDYTVTNRYTVLPYVALSAGSKTMSTLSVLQHNGLVAAIERDGTVSAASNARKCKTVKKKHGKRSKAAKKCAAAQTVH